MNSKERVKAALTGEIPDRCPIGFFAIDGDTAEMVLGRPTYWRSKAKSQIAFWEGRRDEVVQSWKEDGIELYKKLDFIDVIPVCTIMAGLCPPVNSHIEPPERKSEDTWVDKYGRVYRYSPLTKDITIIEDPTIWNSEFDIKNLESSINSSKPDESIFEVVDAFITEFAKDRFVLGPSADELGWYLHGGLERGFMELAIRPEQVKQLYMTMVENACKLDKSYVRPGQSGVLWGTDFSSNKGPMINPKLYKEVFWEGFKRRIDSVKSLDQCVIKHMCGNNWSILDMMVDAGIDCYQSIQESAGMDIVDVYEKYSDSIALWGGVRVEHLVNGTVNDIKKDVQRALNSFKGKSKYIFGTSHSVAVGTKYDNFMAMLDEFHRLCT